MLNNSRLYQTPKERELEREHNKQLGIALDSFGRAILTMCLLGAFGIFLTKFPNVHPMYSITFYLSAPIMAIAVFLWGTLRDPDIK